MIKRIAFSMALLAAAPVGAQQTPDTVQLQPVVVTATRLLTPLSRVPAAVTVLDGDQLRRAGVRTVAEALRTVTGAAVVQSGSYGASTALFLRGGESDYVQVLIDGVQVNSPGEQFNWSNLTIENLERIEIVKGPGSVLYGSDAVAGVVQLITRQTTGRPRGEIAVVGGRGAKVGAQADGAFENLSLRAELAGGSGAGTYSIGLSHFETDGAYAFNNRHRNTSVTARGSLHRGAATQLNAVVRYGKSRFHYPTDGTGQLSDQNQYQDAAMLALGIDATHRLSSRFDAYVGLRHNQNDGTLDDQPDNAADTLGFFSFHSDDRFRRQDADVHINFRVDHASTLTAGTEFEWQSNRASSRSPFGESPAKTEERINRAAYAQWLSDFSRISLQLGVRGEDNEKFGNFVTYRAGLASQIAPAVRVRASAGTAFKEPRFFEQFAEGFVKGNPALEPERTRSLEAGFDVRFGRAGMEASYFHQQFTDLIQYLGMPARPDDPNYVNVAGARAAGLELTTSLVWPRLSLHGGYSRLDTRVTHEGDGSDPSFRAGEPLLRRPRHSGSLGVTANLARGSLTATAYYTGRRSDLDFSAFPANRVTLPAYTRVDVAGQRRVGSAASVSLKVENALAADYQEILGFPARQRVVSLGVALAF